MTTGTDTSVLAATGLAAPAGSVPGRVRPRGGDRPGRCRNGSGRSPGPHDPAPATTPAPTRHPPRPRHPPASSPVRSPVHWPSYAS
ncbi:hypothetical protein WKI68_11660 [Streptomyces sp. MS1.HAVA.3]|uniref:Uncharacterized protein n=1 Tax=Streptomyces caledonius TaxID=3134107 RepID=A0ABU8U346_9ACTN